VSNTDYGSRIFENFIFKICGAKSRFQAQDEAKLAISNLAVQVSGKTVLLALSGGSDSSICAHLIQAAQNGSGKLVAVYIKGIDRPDDEAFVFKHFGNRNWIELVVVDATEELLAELAGKLTMKEKRVAIRTAYKNVLEQIIAERRPDVIVQGTLYTDISESGGGLQTGARKARIKLHHNVNLGFSIPEVMPLALHVKDTARAIGRVIGVDEEVLTRHPFPGVGLGVRIIGEITRPKLAIARACDHSYHDELKKAGLYETIWQSGVVVTDMMHPKSAGDDAGDGPLVLYWAVSSVNGFTAVAFPIPSEVHDRIQRRLGTDVPSIGATAYRTSHKPFSTIEAG
jgi:GMP synthase (glutamine-hydrolysing)